MSPLRSSDSAGDESVSLRSGLSMRADGDPCWQAQRGANSILRRMRAVLRMLNGLSDDQVVVQDLDLELGGQVRGSVERVALRRARGGFGDLALQGSETYCRH